MKRPWGGEGEGEGEDGWCFFAYCGWVGGRDYASFVFCCRPSNFMKLLRPYGEYLNWPLVQQMNDFLSFQQQQQQPPPPTTTTPTTPTTTWQKKGDRTLQNAKTDCQTHPWSDAV